MSKYQPVWLSHLYSLPHLGVNFSSLCVLKYRIFCFLSAFWFKNGQLKSKEKNKQINKKCRKTTKIRTHHWRLSDDQFQSPLPGAQTHNPSCKLIKLQLLQFVSDVLSPLSQIGRLPVSSLSICDKAVF